MIAIIITIMVLEIKIPHSSISFDGKVTFYEPMITCEFLKSQKKYERQIPVPSKLQEEGWYPTAIIIVKHDGQTDVILDKFDHRHKSLQ